MTEHHKRRRERERYIYAKIYKIYILDSELNHGFHANLNLKVGPKWYGLSRTKLRFPMTFLQA